ncbi:hypothetical protein GJ496_007655 [Pomphorhynchus laevis]|nr:hypothetical protein GJ496_007655 [Pomphorhynchus laevis]
MKRETDQIDLIRSTNKSNAQTWRATNKPQSSCTRCGRQHTRFQRCPATGKICRRCGKIGHFEACCRSTNTLTHNNVRAVEMVSDNDSEILRSINTIRHDDIIPIIKIQINGQCINMEFDTGSSVSIISRAVWQHIGEPTLHPVKVLKTYGGKVLQSIGKCLVTATLNKQARLLWVTVLETFCRPLFGRPWISAFKLKWPESVITIREQEINSSPLCSIKATYENNEELYNLLQNYAEVFGPGTTHVKDYEVELTIDTNAIPHCWGSRRVSFCLRESVEAKLQRQLKQRVIEPVDISQKIVDCAAPIVVTHKSDISVIIWAISELQLIHNLQKVLERLKQAGVKVKREKCSFLQERVKFLGHVLTKDCIQACPNKLEAIQKIPTPTNKGELRYFLGAVNYVNRFIPSQQPNCNSVYELSGRRAESLMDARILKNFDIHKDVHLACDASDNGLGAILFKEDSNHVKLPVAYASRTLKPNE